MRIGIYGGTYNPPHLGHFRAAAFAKEALQLDRVLMIPTNISPHKQLPQDSPTPRQRLEMVALGAKEFEGLTACDIELRREGASYTWQTLELLREEYPQDQLVLLMGTDMFLSFLTWREPRRILQDAILGVFYRGDTDEVTLIESQKQTLEAMGARVELVKNPVVDISSTQLRQLLLLGCAGEFLPKTVEGFVYDHGFYGTGRPLENLPPEQLEAVCLGLLKPKRVAHVLGCRDTAVALAKKWGADPEKAARAALLHDITKVFDGALQLTLLRGYGMIPEDFSREAPATIHAKTAALAAQHVFGECSEVVSAISSHTTGAPGMSLLDAIIWMADFIEPNRSFPGVEDVRQLAFTDLKTALITGMNMTIAHVQQQGNTASVITERTLAWLRCEERKIL